MAKVYKVISFNQNEWLKSYIEMNNKLRTEAKNDFEKDFFKLMNNAVFCKTMENMRKHRDIKLVTTEKRRNYLVSKLNVYTTKFFTKNVLVTEMKKTQITMNKPVYLGLSILDIIKTKIYDFWYDYIKPKYGDKSKLCYIDTDTFIVLIKTEDIYKDISEDVEKRFGTSNYEVGRPLPMGKDKNAIGLIKDVLGRQIIKKIVGFYPKTYSYLKDNNDEFKKAKDTKKSVVKRKLTFEYYKRCLKASQIMNIVNYLESKGINVDSLKEDNKNHKKEANI